MIWLSVIEWLIFAFSGIVIVVYGIDVLHTPDTRKAGILTLIFDSTSLSLRGYTPPGLGTAGGIVSSIQGEGSSITLAASVITSAALSIASEAQNVVSSAITAIQSDLSSVIPRNCSLGTRYFCLGYVNNMTCSELPLNVSGLLSKAVTALSSSQLSNLESSLGSVDQKLKYVSPGLIEGPFILGIISTGVLITASLVLAVRFLIFNKESIFEYQFRGLHLEMVFGIITILVDLISFIYLPIALQVVLSKAGHLGFDTNKGTLMDSCLVILSCAIVMTLCVSSMYFQKVHAFQKGREIKRRQSTIL